MVNPYCLEDYGGNSESRIKGHRKSRTPHQSPPERERSKSAVSRFSASPPEIITAIGFQDDTGADSGFDYNLMN